MHFFLIQTISLNLRLCKIRRITIKQKTGIFIPLTISSLKATLQVYLFNEYQKTKKEKDTAVAASARIPSIADPVKV